MVQEFEGHSVYFDSIRFVIDDILWDERVVVGHFVLMKDKKPVLPMPVSRLKKGNIAVLDGITVKTKYKVKFT